MHLTTPRTPALLRLRTTTLMLSTALFVAGLAVATVTPARYGPPG